MQSARALQRTRDLLVRQRTQLTNAIRGLLYEFGLIALKGLAGIGSLLTRIEAKDESLPATLLVCLAQLATQWRALDAAIDAYGETIVAEVRKDKAALRLTKIPGVGPITAHAIIAAVGDGRQFASARDFSAWVGLTRKNHDTGGKTRTTGHISRAGDNGLRRLLTLGASASLRHVRAKPGKGSAWIQGVLARRPVKVAVVAQAAKTARIVWAVLTSGQEYLAPKAAA